MADFEKATYEDLREEEIPRLNRYLLMTKDDLKKIPMNWATGKNITEAGNIDLEDYDIIEVSPVKLISHAHMLVLPTEELFTNDINDFRYVTTLERWENNQSVDPPTVYVHSYENKTVSINDGRHRAVLAYFLNADTIPIVVSKNERNRVAQILSD